MKQIFSAFAFLMMMISAKNSDAQGDSQIAFNNSISTIDLLANQTDKNASGTKVICLTATQVNIDAVRHFMRFHKKVSDERWFRTKDGYIANFLSKGIDTRIVYDDQGRWLYDLLVYTEDKLPVDIRHRVKSQYYDDDITEVRQYETRDKTVYIVLMKDEQSNTKVLQVSDDEIKDVTPHAKN
jgi:hypothetical protein